MRGGQLGAGSGAGMAYMQVAARVFWHCNWLAGSEAYRATSRASSASSARWHALRMAVKVKASGLMPPSAISHTRDTTSPSLRLS